MSRKTVEIHLEHVRSFVEPVDIPIRPLTLLVGENSSGKSTFLAMASCVFETSGFPSRPGFNRPPYSLGNFETIATNKGGKYGKADEFAIGFKAKAAKHKHIQVVAKYQRGLGGPMLSMCNIQIEDYNLEIQATEEEARGFVTSYGVRSEGREFPLEMFQLRFDWRDSQLFFPPNRSNEQLKPRRDIISPLFDSVLSIAPIRTKPKRTYDELAEDYTPEGDHVPKVLARLFSEQPQSAAANDVREALDRFGKDSGLFKQLDVKKLGKNPDDPFQVQVNPGGPKTNLVDVGYGVSQALPVVVQSVLHAQNSLLLIQQPEVHLHPRAQAALGSFFAKMANLGRDTFLIETHSDFLVDRVRMEAARGTIKPEDVLILFFSKDKLDTTVYPLEIDEQGNVLGAPSEYRRFFLETELELLNPGGS